MKLPNGDRAIVDIAKLRDYCLNSEHLEGKSKARVFRSALGLTQKDAELLCEVLLGAARNQEALPGLTDGFGTRYSVEFDVQHGSRRARIRSGWIVAVGEQVPRLTTCYVR